MINALSIRGIIFLIAIFALFGTLISSVVFDATQYVSCGFCQEAGDKLKDDFLSFSTLGQNKIIKGVEGLKGIDNLSLSQTERSELLGYYKNMIFVGVVLSILFIIVFYMIWHYIFKIFTNSSIPIVNLALAIITVGLLSTILSGGEISPFKGWIELFTNFNYLTSTYVTTNTSLSFNDTL